MIELKKFIKPYVKSAQQAERHNVCNKWFVRVRLTHTNEKRNSRPLEASASLFWQKLFFAFPPLPAPPKKKDNLVEPREVKVEILWSGRAYVTWLKHKLHNCVTFGREFLARFYSVHWRHSLKCYFGALVLKLICIVLFQPIQHLLYDRNGRITK